MLEICLLGTGGVMPLPDRYLTSLYAKYNGRKILIDCGEGTQMTIKTLGWGYRHLDAICLTHYHGDHITGLPGILFSLQNTGRVEPITIIGPTGLKEMMDAFTKLYGKVPYEINLMELDMKKQDIKIGEFKITAVPAEHKVLCMSYVIEVERSPKFVMEKAIKNQVPRKYWKRLQNGEEIKEGNKIYIQDMVIGEKRKGIKISYATDTRPTNTILEAVKESDLFICECMYIDEEYLEQVEKNKHMLGVEAAKLARDSECKRLWLTHFSPALSRNKMDIAPIRDVFKNSYFGTDRKVCSLMFEED